MSQDSNKDKNLDKPIDGHDYDGIQELDNPLPKWWLMTFYITIVFAVIYYGYYELGSGPSSDKELSNDLAKISELQKEAELKAVVAGDVDYRELAKDTDAMERARGHFQSKCAACHGQKGEGGIGPNMTDLFYINGGGEFKALLNLVREGNEKGMPKWKGIIPDKEIVEVTAFVRSMAGQNLPGKAHEGSQVSE